MKTSTLDGKIKSLLFLLLISGQSVWAQDLSNYTANTPNSTAPGRVNTLVGPSAGNAITSGSFNVFVGSSAGLNNTVGGNNTFLGTSAGVTNMTGFENTFLGFGAGLSNRSASDNTFVGWGAGLVNETGTQNTFVGHGAGYNNTADFNTFLGQAAGFNTKNGANNVFVGYRAGLRNTVGSTNVFIGPQAGFSNSEASSNTFMGDRAGYSTTTGGSNVFIGNQAGYNNISGQSNMFLGPQAGSNNTTGSYNLFIGNAAGNGTTTGQGNTAIGDGSGFYNTSGQRNTMIGQYAGGNSQTGNDNVFIGFGAKAGPDNPTNLNNAVAIGAYSVVSQSNSVILGNNANVGIGTAAPQNKLEINTGIVDKTGLRFTNLTSLSPASMTDQSKFLTVNELGDVILASTTSGGREGVSESLWQRKGTFLQNTNGEAIIIGSTLSQTPAGYKLFVEEGILTEKVKVAVKNTADWSDKVFAPSYSLRPLAEVDEYIQKHQHLPGVLSAKEMVEQGNDLHKTDATLLEKIEELTLYSIQLEKANREQHEELQSVKQAQNQKLQQQQAEIDELKRLVKQLAEKK